MSWAPMQTIGELCDVIGGGTPDTNRSEYYDGSIPWITVRDMNVDLIETTERNITEIGLRASASNLIAAGNVVIATRVGLGKVCKLVSDCAINQDVKAIIPRNRKILDIDYLYWWLRSVAPQILAEGRGATVLGVKLPFIKSLPIPIPSLDEQKRIVAILDEAFEGIAKATANAERNYTNARELFDTHLFRAEGDEEELGELIDIRTGKLDANAMVSGGAYPFFTCAREIFSINEFAFDCEAVLLAGNNAVGDFNVKHYKGKFNAYQRTYVLTVNQAARISYRYLYYQLRRSLKKFKDQSVGVGTKFLKLGMIKGLRIPLPSIAVQNRIASDLDSLSEATDALADASVRKQLALVEFKKSLLHKAFSGQLTGKDVLAA